MTTSGVAAQHCDVAIIGFGPVGATLANILGCHGITTAVLDRHAAPYPLPRAVSVDDETMRIFQSIGLADDVTRISTIGAGAHFVDAAGKLVVEWLRPREITSNGWYLNNRFHQPDLEAVLRRGLCRYDVVTPLLCREVGALEQDATGVDVHATDLETGEQRRVRASYVVGCDGARSLTREVIGSDFEDLGFDEPWLVVDLLIDTDGPDFGPNSIHYCDPARPASCIFVGGNRRRWEFRLLPGDDPVRMPEPDNVWRLLSKWIGPDKATLERAVVYTFRSTIARRWRRGRLLIAGDAAHLTPPFMAQGMCAGLRDCANLGWKLARVIRGRASEGLLDTYQSERHPHVHAFIALTVEMGRLINKTTSRLSLGSVSQADDEPQRLTQLKPTLGPGLSAGRTGLTGQLFPQPLLASGERLDDRIGGWRPALIVATGIAASAAAELAARTDASDIVLVPARSTGIEDWLGQHRIEAVMLRPDRHILGTAVTTDELRALIDGA